MAKKKSLLVDNTVFASTAAWSRILRYMLQNEARRLLPYKHRTRVCQRLVARGKDSVDVMVDPVKHTALYRNLIVCGMPWCCPVCAARITEYRRIEVAQAVSDLSARAVLVTYTFQHSASERLIDVRQALQDAYSFMWSGRWVGEFEEKWGYVGAIKAMEVTYGKNGFHPHYHCLMFMNTDASVTELENDLQNELRQRWEASLYKFNRFAKWEFGIDLKVAYGNVAEYVEKMGYEPLDDYDWNISHEVAKGSAKMGRLHGYTPNAMLLEVFRGNFVYERIWQEYRAGTVGCRALRWSPGLRELAGLPEKEKGEKEMAEVLPDNYQLFMSFTRTMWEVILDKGLVANVLQIARTNDIEALYDYFNRLGFKFEHIDLRKFDLCT